MISLLLAFLAGLAFTLWLARRPAPDLPRYGSPPPPPREGWLLIVGATAVAGAVIVAAWRWTPAPAHEPPDAAVIPPSASVAPAAAPAPRAPARLIVPGLGVNAPIITVPLVDGRWDVARLDNEVGWLETTGERPGADRAMAFIGHVTLSALERGPFADLWTLTPTAQLTYRAGGMDYLYAVLDVFKVKPQDVDRLFVPDGQRLLLVTCANWNYLTETYNARLVAEAVLVKQQPSP